MLDAADRPALTRLVTLALGLAVGACSRDTIAPQALVGTGADSSGGPMSEAGAPSDASSGGAADARAAADASRPPVTIDYDPCPAAGTPCVVMPLGDSITFGINSTTGAGYRLELLRKTRAAGHAITFVGYETSGPDTLDGQPFPKSNEGHVGYTIDDAPAVGRTGISSFIVASLNLHKPQVVALMIGTNDVDQNNDVANAPARLGRLLDTITSTSPDALVVVSTITPTVRDDENKKIQAYNAAIPAVVAARKGAGKHVYMVDMYSPFVATASYKTTLFTSNDYLHPSDAGYAVMAGVWYAALGPLFR